MNSASLSSKAVLYTFLVTLLSACSGVSFTPTAQSSEDNLQLPDTGAPYISKQESFAFNNAPAFSKVDILFVIDNSGSMKNKQEKLAPGLSDFIYSLGNINWQIGITTTDTSNGVHGVKGALVPLSNGQKILSAGTTNYENVFKQSVVRSDDCNGGCPSSDERPLQAIVNAVEKRHNQNAGFFREGSDLAVVILSDEDEMYALSSPPVKPSAVVQSVKSAFPNKKLTVYGIITKPGDMDCFAQVTPDGKYGTYTAELAQMTGGLLGSICDTNYSGTLTSIGGNLVGGLASLTLSSPPIPSSVQLDIKPFDPGLSWRLMGNTVQFNKQPNQGTRVIVRYGAR
ncbi:MAG: hypothetical protein KF799_02600 [Bdellovibrionales bacterium]|nr:hypothetical protein [Bdellovibrionales bacterium]